MSECCNHNCNQGRDCPLGNKEVTHPVKELHLSLQKSQDGELLAVTYTDDEHRIVEVLWQRPPVKELPTKEDEYWLMVEVLRAKVKEQQAGIELLEAKRLTAYNIGYEDGRKAQEK